ncbi:MAG: tandem-95 repeat protein, partial [Anaerolineales bacterium]
TAQAIQYFPEANYHGTDSFVVTVEDGDGGLDSVTVNVTIEPVNDLPVIAEGASVAVIMDEDGSPTPFNLTLHASDLDADAMLTWSLASPAGNGTAEVSGTGETMPVAYTPSTGYYGSDSFVVEVTDGTDRASITVDVFVNQAGNTPPIIAEGASTALTISEDGNPTPFELSLHASDVDGDPSYWFVSTPAGHGIAGASGTGSSKAIYYTPAPDYYGDDSFIVTVEDGHGGAVTFTIGVTVEPVSDPVSIAEGNQVVVDMDEDGSPTPFGLTLHAEDPDPAETLTWSILTPASHGSAAISGTGISQAVTYTPSLEYAGTDSFVVQVDDGTSSDTISVYTVIHAVNDPVNISEGDSILVSIDEDGSPTAFALILNAVDPDVGEALTWSISTPAGHGTASASGPGASKSIGYIPEANYIGSDMFAVQVTDGANTDFITVSVTMASVNDSPADIGLSAAGVQENLPSGTVVGNLTCTDVDLGDSFIYSLAAGPGDVDNSLFAIVGNELRTAAVFDYEAGSAYSIRVRATDGGGLHHEKVFAIPITDANAAPTDIALSNSSVMGNMLLGTLVGRFSATDAEPAAAPFAYALVPGTGDEDNGSFTISGDQLLTDEVFDFAAKNTYSIRARVTDTGGMSHEETFSIAVTANNYRPILLEPANTASLLNNRPAFDWLSVPDAINYNILISRNNTPTTQVVNLTVTSSSYAPAVDLPAGTLLYWKVRTKWAGGYSPWSEARMLITARPPSVPTLVSPATNALVTNYSLKLDWNNSTVPAGAPDFQHYQIQVATDLDFEEIDTIYLETRTVSEFIPPVPWTANTKYYWRVRAVNALGQYSTWSLVRSLRAAMAAPVPSMPDNDTAPTLVTTMPTFQWGDVDGAAKYTIQISKNANLSSPVVNKIVPTSEYIHAPGLSRNTIYYWRVRAEGPNGPGLWSASWTFKTGNPPTAPVLLAPANNILLTSYQPTLSWKAAAPATGTTVSYYYLQVALDPGFTSLVIDESRGLDLSYHFTNGLAPSKTFYWRVMAFGSNGHYSPWSVVRIFRTPLALPTLLLPSPGEVTTLRQPLFDWDEVQFATSYTIQVSLSPTFTTLSVNVTRTATTYTPTTNLPLGTLHWRVRANGPNGPSPWSYSTVVISVP